MPSLSLHGHLVATESDLPFDPLALLLGGFPESAGAPADLRLSLRAEVRPPPRGEPLFFHGSVQALRAGAELWLVDGRSTLRISADGRAIDAFVAPEAGDDVHHFAHVPLLIALVVALRHRGLFHVHAAALAHPSGAGVLIPAGGGSGKTTLTLALLERGWDFLGDDAAFLAERAGALEVLAFPRPFHVADATARAFGLDTSGGPTSAGKRSWDARAALAGRQRLAMPSPRTLLFCTIAPQARTVASPLTAAEALGGLIESSATVVVPGLAGVGEHLALLGRVAGEAAAHRVELGRDLLEDPRGCAERIERDCSLV